MTQLNIDGRTAMYASAGQNIVFSPIPALFNAISGHIGYNAVMMPYETIPGEFFMTIDALRLLRYKGVFIDTPYRCELDKLLVGITDEASLCDAVNVVRYSSDGLYGHNTEMSAFTKAFPILTGEKLTGKKIFLIGAGGIARAIAFACAGQNCETLTIANRSAEKAQRLCSLVNSHYENTARVADFHDPGTIHSFYHADVIIHATTSGMFPNLYTHPIPEDYQFMAHHLVVDTVYNPPQTKLMQMAEEKGCRFYNGRDIMFFSVVEAYQWWTDVRIDAENEKKLFHIWKEMLYNV